jgi:peptidoglycan-associated lipoprotein
MKTRFGFGAAVLIFTLSFGACAKKKVAATPPPAPSHAPIVAAKQQPAQAVPQRPVQKPATVFASNPPRMPDSATKVQIQDLLNRIQDVYFDYDKHSLRPDAMSALQSDARTLTQIIQQYPDFKLTVEGHCDERGSAEYNLGLGDARAQQAKEFLVTLGLPAAQLQTVSYGKEKPVCSTQSEDCWQKNRRAHIAQVR